MAEKEELELLDLEDEAMPELPEGNPFEQHVRPRRPWLLFGAAIVVIALSAYIIIRVIGKDHGESVDISIDLTPQQPMPASESGDKLVIEPENNEGAPVRVVEDRVDAKFDPAAAPKVTPPKPRPVNKPKPAAPASVRATAPANAQPSSAVVSGWSVQFGSFPTRAGAQTGQKRLETKHQSLFRDQTFIILAAVLPDGSTTYRLRVTGFTSGAEANGFCRNAKSDGLDCYVAK